MWANWSIIIHLFPAIPNSREKTSAAKAKVDALHLQLQNLLYEVLHLQKEVVKCQQFK